MKPIGNGPFPAIIIAHGCRGLTDLEQRALPVALSAWGYVSLAVDSYGPRQVTDACRKEPTSVDRVSDLVGALQFLATMPFVDARRVGVLGVSMGAQAVLGLAEPAAKDSVINPEKLQFAAGAAYYPGCGWLAMMAPSRC